MKTNGISVLDMLSPDRQAAIRMEAAEYETKKAFSEAKTLDDLFTRLQASPLWKVIAEAPLKMNAPEIVKAKPPAKTKAAVKATPKAKPTAKTPVSALLSAMILTYVAANPDLRGQQIQKALSVKNVKAFKRALEQIRTNKQVKTKGKARGTTYRLA